MARTGAPMSPNAKELTVGGLAFLALVLLLGFLYGGRELTAKAASGDYLVVATFNRVEGLLGGKYVRLEPGTDKSFIEDGGTITKTKDFRSPEDPVGEITFLATGGAEERAK